MKLIPLFILIQLTSLLMFFVGIPVCAYLAYCHGYTFDPTTGESHWPQWAHIWDNEEDGILPHWYEAQHHAWTDAHVMFIWTVFRNPVNNLRFVKRFLWLPNLPVSSTSRKLWRVTWGTPATPGAKSRWYAQAGWNSSGFPVLSAGSNPNPF